MSNICYIHIEQIHFQDFIFLDKGGFIMMNHQNMDTISNTTSSSNEDNSTKDHIHTEKRRPTGNKFVRAQAGCY